MVTVEHNGRPVRDGQGVELVEDAANLEVQERDRSVVRMAHVSLRPQVERRRDRQRKHVAIAAVVKVEREPRDSRHVGRGQPVPRQRDVVGPVHVPEALRDPPGGVGPRETRHHEEGSLLRLQPAGRVAQARDRVVREAVVVEMIERLVQRAPGVAGQRRADAGPGSGSARTRARPGIRGVQRVNVVAEAVVRHVGAP